MKTTAYIHTKTSIYANLINSHFTNNPWLKPFTYSSTELCIWSRNRSVSKVRVDWPRSSDDTTADLALLPCCTTRCNRAAVTSECGISWTERNVNSDPKQFTLGVRCVPGQPPSRRRRADILQPQTPHSTPVKHFYCWSAVFCKLTGYCLVLIIEFRKTVLCL